MVNVLEFLSREISLSYVATTLQITMSVIELFPFYITYDFVGPVAQLV